MKTGQAVMVNWSDVAPEHRQAYYDWHCREHMVGRVALPGFIRGRRCVAANASRDFLVWYEVEGIEVLTSQAYLTKANAPSELTRRTTPYIKNSTRGLARVKESYGVGVGGCVLTLRFDAQPGAEAGLESHLSKTLAELAAIPEITGAHFCVADQEASTVVPVERQGRPTQIPRWIVLVEGVTLDAVNAAADAHLADLVRHGATDGVERDTYTLQIMVTK